MTSCATFSVPAPKPISKSPPTTAGSLPSPHRNGSECVASRLKKSTFIQPTTSDASLESKFGYTAIGTFGWAFTNGLRVELEGDFRNNQFSSGRNFGFPARAGGRELKYGPMVNVLYDMTNPLHDYMHVTIPYFAPYIGVGVGYQWSHLSGFTASAASGFPSVASDDTYGAIAYQFILSGAVPVPSIRGLAMTVDYRFLGVGSRKYDVAAQATATSPFTFGSAKLGNDFNHAIVIGLR
jgi:hypothetical protein